MANHGENGVTVFCGRHLFLHAVVVAAAIVLSGCQQQFKTLEDARTYISDQGMGPEKALRWLSPHDMTGRTLLRDIATLGNIEQRWIRGVGVVVNLAGTGGSGAIVDERTRANAVKCLVQEGIPAETGKEMLKSDSTAIVRVLASVPVIVRQDQRINAYVVAVDESRSLAGGLLCDTQLRPYAAVGGIQREGSAVMFARGPVVVGVPPPPGIPRSRASGVVPNGATSAKKRTPYLQLHEKDVKTALFVAGKINTRFGDISVALNDGFVSVDIPSYYAREPLRFLEVVLRLDAHMPNAATKMLKRGRLRSALFSGDPKKCHEAALELEAWGLEGVSILEEGLDSSDDQVKAECAAALVYRRNPDAVSYYKNKAASGSLSERITAIRKLGIYATVPAPSEAARAQSERDIGAFLRGLFEKHEFASDQEEALTKFYAMTTLEDMGLSGAPYFKRYVGRVVTISSIGKEYGPAAVVVDADTSRVLVFGEDMEVKAPFEYDLRCAKITYAPGDPLVVMTPTLAGITGPRFAKPSVADLVYSVGKLPVVFDDIRFMLTRMQEQGVIDAEVYLTRPERSP